MQPDLATLRTGAETANTDASRVTESIPGLLSGLKTNLTSIFTKDNPMFADRENALQTFLNTPSATRAELLPGNQPMVEGSPLNFSPTQQNAMVTARSNAAMVPLAGLNQSIVGQYGNLADQLSAAGGIFQSQAQTAQQKAANALNLYKTAIDEYNAVTSRNKANEGSGGLDLSALIAALLGGGQNQKPDISQFDQPDVPTVETAASPIDFRSQPIGPSAPGIWDSLLGLLGATPKQGFEQPAQPGGLNLSGYNLGNTPIKLGV